MAENYFGKTFQIHKINLRHMTDITSSAMQRRKEQKTISDFVILSIADVAIAAIAVVAQIILNSIKRFRVLTNWKTQII